MIGLKLVAIHEKPPFPPPKNLKGCKAKGRAFEKGFGKVLAKALRGSPRSEVLYPGELFSGTWLRFEDQNGIGSAQPDHFIVQADRIILFENKLTQCQNGWTQMRELYAPLLERLFKRPVICILVCKFLQSSPENLISGLDEISDGATLHWMQRGGGV